MSTRQFLSTTKQTGMGRFESDSEGFDVEPDSDGGDGAGVVDGSRSRRQVARLDDCSASNRASESAHQDDGSRAAESRGREQGQDQADQSICPTCGDSPDDLRRHHLVEHGTPLWGCENCGTLYSPSTDDQRYCCRDCAYEGRRVEKVTVTCRQCLTRFRAKETEARKFCSPECHQAFAKEVYA